MSNFPRFLSGSAAILFVLVLLAGLFAGPQSSRSDEWRKVTVVYTADVNGKIEPCG